MLVTERALAFHITQSVVIAKTMRPNFCTIDTSKKTFYLRMFKVEVEVEVKFFQVVDGGNTRLGGDRAKTLFFESSSFPALQLSNAMGV